MKRLYLGKAAEVFCLLDDQDYEWAMQWCWHITWDRHHAKMYATRVTRRRKLHDKQVKVYLHKEILKRAMKLPPSPKHTIGDHEDGDSLNNTRDNLRWATAQMNALNRRGSYAAEKAAQRPEEVPF